MAQPTGWFLYRDPHSEDGKPTSAARSYWPESTVVEVWNRSVPTWTSRPILDSLGEDPSWQEATRAEVERWVEAVTSP